MPSQTCIASFMQIGKSLVRAGPRRGFSVNTPSRTYKADRRKVLNGECYSRRIDELLVSPQMMNAFVLVQKRQLTLDMRCF